MSEACPIDGRPAPASTPAPLAGIDFTSRPTPRKPITVALGRLADGVLTLDRIDAYADFAGFAAWLADPAPRIAAFDLPFGLPRELVVALGWPLDWLPLMRHYASLSRAEIRATFAAFCAARPVGARFAHRATDIPARSSPSMKWVNPPVAFMLHAGVPLLIDAGFDIPGLHPGDPGRVALEGYPGLLAREVLGLRSYKSDERAKQTPERSAAREALVEALVEGRTRPGLRLRLSGHQHAELVADPGADRLDAVLCLVQAAWASGRPNHGLPPAVDPLEGWIVGAGA